MALTAGEQYLLELINRARLDPAAEAKRYNLDLNEGLAAGTISSDALQVLAPDAKLESAASAHSNWMLQTNQFSHTGGGGSDASDRITANGYRFEGSWGWRENLAWVGSTGRVDMDAAIEQHHEGLYRSESHRVNTFAAEMREIGIGQVAGTFSQGGATYNSSMLTENFAMSGTQVHVTGVAYRDTDRDAFYSIGEGRSGIWIRGDGARDTTSAAGGYGLAVDAQDDLRIQIGSGGRMMAQLDVDTSAGNVKVDVVALAGGGQALDLSGSAHLVSGIGTARLLGVGDLDLEGHDGANKLTGNAGANDITGRGGNDMIEGGGGHDALNGGGGRDVLNGDTGNDRINGGNDADRLFGGAGADRLVAGFGNDDLNGGAGNDRLFGEAGNDRLIGGTGDDRLMGGNANDKLWGGAGADVIDGGRGNDLLVGDAGRDRFVFSGGRDRVLDFENDVDTIYIRSVHVGDHDAGLTLAEVMDMGRIVKGDAVFDFGHGDILTIDDVSNLNILVNDMIII